MASSGRSAMGVFSVQSYLRSNASSCQKMSKFFCLPKGTMPPSAMHCRRLGMTFSKSISLMVPSPLQRGQAPCGELNEKLLGAGSL